MVEDFDMLAATLAHEIKNPLALVRANLDYIELCDTEKRHSKNYSVMKTQLERTDSMIKDFVGLMLSSGGEDASVDMRIIIESVVADYNSPGNGLEFVLEFESGMIVRGNARLLAIVFSNAVKNSIEAGASRIRIHGEMALERLNFTITDNGSGLTPQTLEYICEDGGYTTKKYGNGLGVLISRHIINGCGGSYSIDNAKTGGCEVRIELPDKNMSIE